MEKKYIIVIREWVVRRNYHKILKYEWLNVGMLTTNIQPTNRINLFPY